MKFYIVTALFVNSRHPYGTNQRQTEWPRLKDTAFHLNGIEQRYF